MCGILLGAVLKPGCEGMSDYYRDRVRHGGILSNDFIGKTFDIFIQVTIPHRS